MNNDCKYQPSWFGGCAGRHPPTYSHKMLESDVLNKISSRLCSAAAALFPPPSPPNPPSPLPPLSLLPPLEEVGDETVVVRVVDAVVEDVDELDKRLTRRRILMSISCPYNGVNSRLVFVNANTPEIDRMIIQMKIINWLVKWH